MPRNHSEQSRFPHIFPLNGAPDDGLSPKVHERIFWANGVVFGISEVQPEANKKYREVCTLFSPAEENEFFRCNRKAMGDFYRAWWAQHYPKAKDEGSPEASAHAT